MSQIFMQVICSFILFNLHYQSLHFNCKFVESNVLLLVEHGTLTNYSRAIKLLFMVTKVGCYCNG